MKVTLPLPIAAVTHTPMVAVVTVRANCLTGKLLIYLKDNNVTSRIVETASADLSNLKEAVVDKTRKIGEMAWEWFSDLQDRYT